MESSSVDLVLILEYHQLFLQIQSLVFGEMNPYRHGFFADKDKALEYFDFPFGPLRDSIESLDGSGVSSVGGLFTY